MVRYPFRPVDEYLDAEELFRPSSKQFVHQLQDRITRLEALLEAQGQQRDCNSASHNQDQTCSDESRRSDQPPLNVNNASKTPTVEPELVPKPIQETESLSLEDLNFLNSLDQQFHDHNHGQPELELGSNLIFAPCASHDSQIIPPKTTPGEANVRLAHVDNRQQKQNPRTFDEQQNNNTSWLPISEDPAHLAQRSDELSDQLDSNKSHYKLGERGELHFFGPTSNYYALSLVSANSSSPESTTSRAHSEALPGYAGLQEQLLNLFWSHPSPYLYLLDRDGFMDGLKKGVRTPYYSPLLMTVVLLRALRLSDSSTALRLAPTLLDRAQEQLWEESEYPDLSTVIALCFLANYLSSQSRNGRGWIFMGESGWS